MANNAISSLSFDSTNNHVITIPYGSCSTAAGTAAKTVSVGNFSLETGAIVAVKFTATNSASSPTLNVSSTGAKAIYYKGAAITASYLKANYTYQFMYNGTQWDLIGEIDTNTNTDTKVRQYITTSMDDAEYPLLTRYSTSEIENYAADYSKFRTGVTLNPSTNTITASKFNGALTGNADTATSATTANKTTGTLTVDVNGTSTAFNGSANKSITINAATLGLSSAMKFLGTSATAISDGATTNPITIGSTSTTATSGNVVLYSGKEYVWTGSAWEELGDEGSHALKTITITGENGLTGGGTLEANRTISHADTSTQASVSASGRRYITGVTLDDYGHVTGLTTGTETVVDTNTDTNYYHTPSYSTGYKIATGNGVADMWVPAANGTTPGLTIVYPAANCTTFSSDSGTVTPLAVQKGAKQFAITRPTSEATAVPRFTNTTGDVESTKVKIETVTNTKDTSKTANVLVIPAEGSKKMVYGYCTDQTDGTSFIGGVFDSTATEYPYASGLAIGGTSGNLLWKGKQVATTDMLPSGDITGVTAGTGLSGGGTSGSVTLSLGTSGVTAGTYGPSANVSGTNGTTLTVPEITVDSYGRVTGVTNRTYTSVNTDSGDTKVTQAAAITTNGAYPVLLGYSTATTAVTNTVNKSSKMTFNPSTGQLAISGADSTSTTTGALKVTGGVGVSGSVYAGSVYGAVWNDYAEYREGTAQFEPGRVICENGDDTLSLATERLQPGANVVSDTFGFAIGETEQAKTPIAVSGRVLVYPYEDRNSYAPGDAVCAAPNGTVSKMTREEIREYPERIIGTVSAIPSYETWGEGNVPVNGRIWVKIK